MKYRSLLVGTLLSLFTLTANSALLTSTDENLLFWYDNDVNTRGGIQLQRNQLLGTIEPYGSGEFTVSFYLNVQGTVSNWGSILHVGNVNTQRWPGLWLRPGATGLHTRVSRPGSWNYGFSDTAPLGVNSELWRHIVVTDTGSNLNLYIDGALIQTISGTQTPYTASETSINVYAGDPWYEAVVGRIDDIRIYNEAVSLRELSELPPTEVPEPSSIALLAMSLLLAGRRALRK